MSTSKRTLINKLAFGLLGFAFFIAIWALISYGMHQHQNTLLPYPHEVFIKMNQLLWVGEEGASTWIAIGWSLARILIGFVASFVLGAILGTLGGLYANLRNFVAPYVTFAKTMPTAAFVLILIGIFYQFKGLPEYIPCFLVFLVVFPLIYEAFESGIANESPDIKDALSLDGGFRSVSSIVHVLWPDSLSYIMLSIAQSLGLAVKVAVMSEILVNSSSVSGGLGGRIQNAMLTIDMEAVIAYSVIAVCLVLIIDIPLYYVKKKIKKKLD